MFVTSKTQRRHLVQLVAGKQLTHYELFVWYLKNIETFSILIRGQIFTFVHRIAQLDSNDHKDGHHQRRFDYK